MKKKEDTQKQEKNEDVLYNPENVKGRYNFMFDEAVLQDDKTWKVVRTVKQGISFDMETMFIRDFSVMGLDKNFDAAQKTTLNSVISLITEYNDDFFSKEVWDHKQYAVKMGTSEGEQNVLPEDDKNTET